jgi:hypothetical protein
MTRLAHLIAAVSIASLGLAQESDMDQRIRTLGGMDPALTRSFFTEMRQAIIDGDCTNVSKLIRYPITVYIEKRRKKIHTAAEFESLYPAIINPYVRQAVIDQTYDDLFVRSPGVAISNGIIWFSAIQSKSGKFDRFKILAINNLPPSP